MERHYLSAEVPEGADRWGVEEAAVPSVASARRLRKARREPLEAFSPDE